MSSSKLCPIWRKEKEILKLKLKESSTSIMYLKPNMPSYASAYASALEVTTQDSLTQTGDSQILSPTSVKKSANSSSRNSLSKPTPAGSSGVAAPKPTAFTITKSVATNLPTLVERNPRSPKKGNEKLRSDRVPKRANDPVALRT